MATILFTNTVTEVYDFEGDGSAVIASAHDLTSVNTPTFGATSPPQGSQYADLDVATNEHFILSDHVDFDADSGDYSCAFWLNAKSTQPNIAAKGDAFGTNSWLILTEFRSGASFDIAVKHRTASVNHYSLSGFDIAANTNAWFHIVLSYDQSVGEITWWVSNTTTFGSEINANAVGMAGVAAANADPLYIGGTSATTTFDGGMDEFAWFKGTTLTASDAEEIYLGTAPGGWRAGATAASISSVNSSRGVDIATANESLTITVDDSTSIFSVTVNAVSCSNVTLPTGTSVTCTCPLGFNIPYGTIVDVVVNNGIDSVGYAISAMPPGGMVETDFTVDYISLDPDSPFANDDNFSALVSGDSCIYDAVTTPDGHSLTMNGLGEFAVIGMVTPQVFNYYIFDVSDNTTSSTIEQITIVIIVIPLDLDCTVWVRQNSTPFIDGNYPLSVRP